MINPGGTNEKFAHANLKHAQLIVHLEQPFGNMKGVMEHASNKETYRHTCGKPDDWEHSWMTSSEAASRAEIAQISVNRKGSNFKYWNMSPTSEIS